MEKVLDVYKRPFDPLNNNRNAKVKWQFTTKDARIKLSRLYPMLEETVATQMTFELYSKGNQPWK
jgi:hypothetical protein